VGREADSDRSMLWRRDLLCRGGREADSDGSMSSSSDKRSHEPLEKELWLSLDGEEMEGLLLAG
jgi:hypothetical protein